MKKVEKFGEKLVGDPNDYKNLSSSLKNTKTISICNCLTSTSNKLGQFHTTKVKNETCIYCGYCPVYVPPFKESINTDNQGEDYDFIEGNSRFYIGISDSEDN